MRGVFIDANGSLATIFERQTVAGDPPVKVNRNADITADEIPAALGGAEIIIIDHTPLPTEIIVPNIASRNTETSNSTPPRSSFWT